MVKIMDIMECKKICHSNFRGKVRRVVDAQIDKFFEIEKSGFKLQPHGYKLGDYVYLNKNNLDIDYMC